MKIFISWSGNASRAVAVALREWLPSVLQVVEAYVSSEDIEKGARWSAEIAQQLNDTYFGIICVTKENVGAAWLNFEAGALSKSVDTSRVSPFLLDMRSADLVGPLSQFQATLPQLEDMTRLLKSINSSTERPVDEVRLTKSVEMWWPALEEQLNAIRREEPQVATEPERKATDMIKELLEITRGIQRRLLSGGTAESARETGPSYRPTIAIATERIPSMEKLLLAKLQAAFADSHNVTSEATAASDIGVALDAIVSPREAGGESYLVEIKYAPGPKALLNRILDGVGRLSIARSAYGAHASGPIRCILLFILVSPDEGFLPMFKRRLETLPEDIDAVVIYESELSQMPPSELRERFTAGHNDPS
jgi:hypothetical protein